MTDDQMIRIALTSAAAALVTLLLGNRKREELPRKIGPVTRLAYKLGKLWARRSLFRQRGFVRL